MMSERRLSAMEYTVLGIAWKRGPCTTYALMKELSSSTSTFYKNRAGTAYPLVNRLLTSGLLAASSDPGANGERLVEVTALGLTALKEWISTPIDFAEVAHTMDLVRLRVFYLGAARPADRDNIVGEALESLGRHLIACEDAIARYRSLGDVFSELATVGVIHETRARIGWLTEVREQLVALPTGRPASP